MCMHSQIHKKNDVSRFALELYIPEFLIRICLDSLVAGRRASIYWTFNLKIGLKNRKCLKYFCEIKSFHLVIQIK